MVFSLVINKINKHIFATVPQKISKLVQYKQVSVVSASTCMVDAGLEQYVDVERASPELSDGQHIYNKALFDAINEALKELMPPYTRRLSDAQRRVRRHLIGSKTWQEAIQAEVTKLVVNWMTPRHDVESLLLEDLKQVCHLQITHSQLTSRQCHSKELRACPVYLATNTCCSPVQM